MEKEKIQDPLALEISAILGLPIGTVIPSVEGRLINIQPIQKRTRPDAENYTFQQAELFDGEVKIGVVIYDHEDMHYFEGMRMLLRSKKSRNNRFGGVIVSKGHAPEMSLFARRAGRVAIRVTKAGVIEPIPTK